MLNGRSGVSEATRVSVLTALDVLGLDVLGLDVLGYERPTKLRGERGRLVGLVLPELQKIAGDDWLVERTNFSMESARLAAGRLTFSVTIKNQGSTASASGSHGVTLTILSGRGPLRVCHASS